MIDPRSQYMIYKHQENERMAQIERNLADQAQKRGMCEETDQPWYSEAWEWLKENVFLRGAVKQQHISAESPCQGEVEGG